MKTIISEQDRPTLIEQFNTTHDPTTLGFCLTQLFEHATVSYSNNIAVIYGNTKLTYQKLNASANRLARVFVEERGVGRGDIVCVALDRSIDLITAILAVLKLGAVYVPIDPTFPTERIAHVLEDAGPKFIITNDSTLAALPSWKNVCLDFNEARNEVEHSKSSNLFSRDVRAEDLAYIIYTSGSTGRPNGVEVNHGALCNLLLSLQQEPGCSPGDRLLAVTTVSFDVSIVDLLLPLVSGAMVVIAQTCELRDPGALLGAMRRHLINIMQATPSLWQMLLDGEWRGHPRLAKILTGGEPISRRLTERLLACADVVWNVYGPTEATVYASAGRLTGDDADIIIGNPIANLQLYVLHTEDHSPVPFGCLGELCISGAGVSQGYRNKPQLTRTRFLENNPFHKGRLYRTGDLARFIAPGKLSPVGRTDSQVKVRDYRIELGDISAAIVEHKDVSAAIVVTHDNQLVAYYVRNNDNNNKEDKATSPLDCVLRVWLAERRPAYMIPAFFVEMDAFPISLNGKIDRKALPNPISAARPQFVIAEPKTELECCVLTIWSRVLGHDRIGINDNFFQVGGNSLHVPRVKMELEKLLDRPVLAAKLFEHYIIKTLASYLDHSEDNGNPTTKHASCFQKTQFQEQECHRSTLVDESKSNDDNKISGNDNDYEDIAIISMACRLPGGITNPVGYWELLEKGEDAITDVPKSRWDADALYDPNPDAPGKLYCRRGGFIMDDDDSFDAPFFGISPLEARTLDPMQHIMLETCWVHYTKVARQPDGCIHGTY